jgi:hypothetical protein
MNTSLCGYVKLVKKFFMLRIQGLSSVYASARIAITSLRTDGRLIIRIKQNKADESYFALISFTGIIHL